MKKTASLFVFLFAISTLAVSANAISPQQPVPEEKKRAMHKLDPIDIFPQVQERGGRERNRDKRASSNDASAILANESANAASNSSSKRSSRKKNSSPETSTTDLANTANQLPTPSVISDNSTATATAINSQSQASPVTAAQSQPDFTEKANSTTAASSQTLAAMNTSPIPSTAAASKDSALPLPIILALLVIVLTMLILVFTKLIRYLRNPVS